MSRKFSTAARGGLIVFAIILEVVVANFLIQNPPANLAAVFGTAGGLSALALHVLASTLLAAGFGGFLPGRRAADRASVVALYCIVALILPGAGIVGVVLLGWVLKGGGKEAESDAEFEIGNPLLEIQGGHVEAPVSPHLETLAESQRSLATEQLRSAVLALRGRSALPDVAALLRRFRGDPDSELQSYADSALAGAVDRSEARATALAARIEALPRDPLAHAWVAEGLIGSANETGTEPADRRRLASAALTHLDIAREERPTSRCIARMIARANILADDPEAARSALADEPASSPESLETLFHERGWEELRKLADSFAEVRPELRESLAFWATDRERGAA